MCDNLVFFKVVKRKTKHAHQKNKLLLLTCYSLELNIVVCTCVLKFKDRCKHAHQKDKLVLLTCYNLELSRHCRLYLCVEVQRLMDKEVSRSKWPTR